MSSENDNVQISIYCLVYNHEKYLKECLNGIVKQKTNFKFEAIVHDDASTDGSAKIIKEYELNYPNIIKPIYQTENQYSKGVSIGRTFIQPLLIGKYIAACEGDDYWTDPFKLQKQFDFLESHPEYFAIGHNVQVIEDDGSPLLETSELYFPYLRYYTSMKDHDLTAMEVEKGIMFGQTCTRLYRNYYKILPANFFDIIYNIKSPNGDQRNSLICYCMGKVRCSAEVMAKHRKSLTNDSYTARQNRLKSQNINLEKTTFAFLMGQKTIAEYFNANLNFSKLFIYNLEAARRLYKENKRQIDKEIYLYLLKHSPYTGKFRLYMLFSIFKKFIKRIPVIGTFFLKLKGRLKSSGGQPTCKNSL